MGNLHYPLAYIPGTNYTYGLASQKSVMEIVMVVKLTFMRHGISDLNLPQKI